MNLWRATLFKFIHAPSHQLCTWRFIGTQSFHAACRTALNCHPTTPCIAEGIHFVHVAACNIHTNFEQRGSPADEYPLPAHASRSIFTSGRTSSIYAVQLAIIIKFFLRQMQTCNPRRIIPRVQVHRADAGVSLLPRMNNTYSSSSFVQNEFIMRMLILQILTCSIRRHAPLQACTICPGRFKHQDPP